MKYVFILAALLTACAQNNPPNSGVRGDAIVIPQAVPQRSTVLDREPEEEGARPLPDPAHPKMNDL
ncbi:MAG: hypothetical protein Q4C89_04320 [Deinococcus sp.]|uniref:hypothetical protein n=1 Tax=Deinococcus sp. TaxID=47478 RepID=UPI0026DB5937|nr:hypothetical protein [Deinococcus sp.]MDO4245227.1 hypothetical protein [Deinococcus sp.]